MSSTILLILGLLLLIDCSSGQFKFHKKYNYLRKQLKVLGKIEGAKWDPQKICSEPKLVVDYYCYTCFCDKNGEMALCKSNNKCKNVRLFAMYPDAELSEEQLFL